MFNQCFTVTGSSLKLLNPGEQGIVSRFRGLDEHLTCELKRMGIRVGTRITLEQRFPHFRVKVGSNSFAIEKRLIDTMYVRVGEEQFALQSTAKQHEPLSRLSPSSY